MKDMETDLRIRRGQPARKKRGAAAGIGPKEAIENVLGKLRTGMVASLANEFFLLREAACDAAPLNVEFTFEITATLGAETRSGFFVWEVTGKGEGGITLTAKCNGRKAAKDGAS
jgi:hypothetical protein